MFTGLNIRYHNMIAQLFTCKEFLSASQIWGKSMKCK